MDFKDKIILITGASSGIGKETAIQFAKKGSNVILVARRKQKLEQIADDLKKFNISTMICECDVSDKLQVEKMATNYFGMIYCIKNFLPSMIQKKSGHIVNVASVAASFGLPGIASYCASKFAMLGFSEGLKHELKGTGVGITVVSPIMVRTDFFDHPSF